MYSVQLYLCLCLHALWRRPRAKTQDSRIKKFGENGAEEKGNRVHSYLINWLFSSQFRIQTPDSRLTLNFNWKLETGNYKLEMGTDWLIFSLLFSSPLSFSPLVCPLVFDVVSHLPSLCLSLEIRLFSCGSFISLHGLELTKYKNYKLPSPTTN